MKRAAFLLGVLAGCTGNASGVPSTSRERVADASTEMPLETLVPHVTTVLEARGDTRFVDVLVDGTVVMLDAEGLMARGASGATQIAPANELGAVSLAFLAGDVVFAATERGWVAIEAGAVRRAALETSLPAGACRSVAPFDTQTVFFAHEGGVAIAEGRGLREMNLDVPFDASSIVAGSAGTLWALSEGRVLEIDTIERTARRTRDGGARDIAVVRGEAFVAYDDGTVTRGETSGSLTLAAELFGAIDLISAGDALWIRTDETWLYLEGETLYEVTVDAPPHAMGAPDGSLVFAEDGVVKRASPRWDLRLEGIEEGEEILALRTVVVRSDNDKPPTSLVATIDGVELDVEAGMLTLDPANIVTGDRTLIVTASWDDGSLPTRLERHIVVMGEPPTWRGQIEAIYEMRCSRCHGRSGAKSLDSVALWQAREAEIRDALAAGRMPKDGPLPAIELARVVAWMDAGFPEGE